MAQELDGRIPEGSTKPSRRGRKPQPERRAEIARAALVCMAEHGLEGATNARIAATLGLSAPAIYGHFESRQDMLFMAMDLLVERIELWLATSQNPDALERLRELGKSHARFMAEEVEGFVLPSFEFIVSPRKLNLSKPFGERQLQMIHAIQGIVEDGQAQGTIREDIDAESMAWEFTILAWAEDVARLASLDQYKNNGIADRILDRFIAGIEAVAEERPESVRPE